MGGWVMKEVPNPAPDIIWREAQTVLSYVFEVAGCLNPITDNIESAWQGETPERRQFMDVMQFSRQRLANLNGDIYTAIMNVRAHENPTIFKQVWEE